MAQAPQVSQFAQNAGVGASITTGAAVTLWVFRCITQHQLVMPDETVALMLSSYFFPISVACRDFVLSFINRETAGIADASAAEKV